MKINANVNEFGDVIFDCPFCDRKNRMATDNTWFRWLYESGYKCHDSDSKIAKVKSIQMVIELEE